MEKKLLDFDPIPEKRFSDWLLKPKNIGQALRKVCNELIVNVLEQKIDFALTEEYEAFSAIYHQRKCFLRKIFLMGDGIPLTYGRVIVPESVYLKHLHQFKQLGMKLLGETLLYNNPLTTRDPFEYNYFIASHPVYNEILQFLPSTSMKPISLWARRSVFYMDGVDPILVMEAFLEEIPNLIP